MPTIQITKKINPAQLHDEIVAAVPASVVVRIEPSGDQVALADSLAVFGNGKMRFPDAVPAASVQAVIDAHVPQPSVVLDPGTELDAALAALPAAATVADVVKVLRGQAGRKGRIAARAI